MNERIRLLAEQADRWAQKMTRSDDPRYGDRPVSDLFDEKFAELIVRECMDVVRHINQDYDGGSTTINAADEIKEHFGVEE